MEKRLLPNSVKDVLSLGWGFPSGSDSKNLPAMQET